MIFFVQSIFGGMIRSIVFIIYEMLLTFRSIINEIISFANTFIIAFHFRPL